MTIMQMKPKKATLNSGFLNLTVEVRIGGAWPVPAPDDQTTSGFTHVLDEDEKKFLKSKAEILVWCRYPLLFILSHELCHVVHLVLKRRGIKETDEINEVFAYLMGHYIEQLHKKKILNERLPYEELAETK